MRTRRRFAGYAALCCRRRRMRVGRWESRGRRKGGAGEKSKFVEEDVGRMDDRQER